MPNINSSTITEKLFNILDYDSNGIIDYKDFTIMTYNFNPNAIVFKNFLNTIRSIKIDHDLKVDVDNFFDAVSIENQDFLTKSNHFVKFMKS